MPMMVHFRTMTMSCLKYLIEMYPDADADTATKGASGPSEPPAAILKRLQQI